MSISDRVASVGALTVLILMAIGVTVTVLADNYGTRYHLVIEQRYTMPPQYAMEACLFFDHDCNVYGYRWDVTPEGKVEALKQIEWFKGYKKSTIQKVN